MHLFAPRAAWRMGGATPEKTPPGAGKNAPQGVIVNYFLGKDVKPETVVKLAFLGRDGSVIREFSTAEKDDSKEKLPAPKPGLNRFAWDLRHTEAKKFEGLVLWGGGTTGPRVPPGTYDVRLTVGEETRTTTAEVRQDPRTTAAAADLQAQYDFLLAANRKLTEVHTQIERIREVRKQLEDLKKRVGEGPVTEAAKALDAKMTKIEETLYQTKNRSPQDPLNFPIRLNDKLASVADSASAGDFAPTAQQRTVAAALLSQIDAQLAQLKEIWEKDLPALNALAAGIPAIK